MDEIAKTWEWVVCRKCGTKTLKAKFCMRCGAELVYRPKVSRSYVFDALVVGEDTVGKSTFIEKITSTGEVVSRQPPSDGLSAIWVLRDVEVIITFVEKSAVDFRPNDQMNALLLLFDLTNTLTFVKCFRVLKMVKAMKDKFNTYLVGNKADLIVDRAVRREEAVKAANEFGVSYFEASSISAEGINSLRQTLIKDLLQFRLETVKRVLKRDGRFASQT
uniref:GTP-binding protein n=1 Tax=Caldiarchaeum subterraneum TaxID=311458 RepID=A0A7C5U682_CALS0